MRFPTFFRILAAVLAIGLPCAASSAAAVDAAGAKALETVLEQRLASLARGDGVRLERAPDAVVTPGGDAYAVRLPQVRVVTPTGALVEAAEIVGTAKPLPGGGWEIEARIPAPLVVFGPEGFRLGEITVGRQTFVGRWADALRTLVGLDASLRDVLFTPREGKGVWRLASFAATMKPDSYAGGRWTGPATLTVGELSARDRQGAEILALHRLTARLRIEGLDVARYAAWNAAVAKIGLAGQDETAALLEALPQLDRLVAGLGATVEVKDFRRVRDDGTREALATLTAVLEGAGLDGDRARLSLDYKHGGLSLAGPAVRRAVVPPDGVLKLSASRLPLATAREAWIARLRTAPTVGEGEAERRFQARIMQAMGAAAGEIRLDRLDFQAPDAGAAGNGVFTFDAATARGLTGGLTLTLRGFEALVAQFGGGGRNPGPALALYALQGLGAPAPDRQGRPTSTYRVEIAPDGRVLLNGSEVSSLVNGLLSAR